MPRQLSVDAFCGLIDVLLRSGYPPLEEVARLLNFSPRTLQRLLSEKGVSYSDLIDRCRCHAACDSLEQTHEPIHHIATAVGYSDPSSFARAFRRWTGQTPRAYRNQALGRQGNPLN